MTSEKSEVEALIDAAVRAVNEAGGSAEARTDVSLVLGKVVDVVAAAVRAQDAVRGGTLSAEQLSRMASACDGDEGAGTLAEMLGQALDNSAAQGRTIAALQEKAERWEEEAEAQTARAGLAEKECDEARATIAARDARIAELEARERALLASVLGTIGGVVDGAPTGAHNFLQRLRSLVAAESALATLRQAFETFLPEERPEWTFLNHRSDRAVWGDKVCAVVGDEEAECTCGGTEQGRLVSAALTALREYDGGKGATPAPEHPDTAALRLARQRLDHRSELLGAYHTSCTPNMPTRPSISGLQGVGRYLLGLVDSGPSGGGEKVESCRACGSTEPNHDPGAKLLATTTPPDVAAAPLGSGFVSPAPVDVATEADEERDQPCHCVTDDNPGGGCDACHPKPEPSAEDDWRTVEQYLSVRGGDDTDGAMAAFARLKDAPRKAAEAMRERCATTAQAIAANYRANQARMETDVMRTAQAYGAGAAEDVALTIRALPLD